MMLVPGWARHEKKEKKKMIDRIDRIQVVVENLDQAAKTFEGVLGAEIRREDVIKHYNAKRLVLSVGESEFELLQPEGSGVTATHLERKGEGLFGAGISLADPEQLKPRLEKLGISYFEEGDQYFISPEGTMGVPFVVSQTHPRVRVGPTKNFYEITNTIVEDWRKAAIWYSGLFGLDSARFVPIESAKYGYKGLLTLFNRPDRLDRIEISQVLDKNSAMGRWTSKHGNSLYMCYTEAHDLPDVIDRLNRTGTRWIPRGGDLASE